jgi:hypothetical protein
MEVGVYELRGTQCLRSIPEYLLAVPLPFSMQNFNMHKQASPDLLTVHHSPSRRRNATDANVLARDQMADYGSRRLTHSNPEKKKVGRTGRLYGQV